MTSMHLEVIHKHQDYDNDYDNEPQMFANASNDNTMTTDSIPLFV